MDPSKMSSLELLRLHAQISEELRRRGITRSSNNPTGDLAEHIFCKALEWNQAANSHPNVDATCPNGKRYQIKGRRVTNRNKSRQLSAIRDLSGAHFDFLAGVLFSEDYSITKAAIIPRAVVEQHSKFVARTNSHKFYLRDEVWNLPGVIDVTDKLKAIAI